MPSSADLTHQYDLRIDLGIQAAEQAGDLIDETTARLLAARFAEAAGSALGMFAQHGVFEQAGAFTKREAIAELQDAPVHAGEEAWAAALWDFLDPIDYRELFPEAAS